MIPRMIRSFRDEETGFAISYPKGWARLQTQDIQARLLVSPNGADSLLVQPAMMAVDLLVNLRAQTRVRLTAFSVKAPASMVSVR